MKISNLKINIKSLKDKAVNSWKAKNKNQKKAFIIKSSIPLAVITTMLTSCAINGKDKDDSEDITTSISSLETTEPKTSSFLDDLQVSVDKSISGLNETLLNTLNNDIKDSIKEIETSTDDFMSKVKENDTKSKKELPKDNDKKDIKEDSNSDKEVSDNIYVDSNEDYVNVSDNYESTVVDDSYDDNTYDDYDNSLDDFEFEEDNTDDNDKGYVDENGDLWSNEDAYNQAVNPDYKDEGLYEAPDSTLWDSEDLYNETMQELEELYNSDNLELEDPIVEDVDKTEEEPIIEEFEGYEAPDGKNWSSEEDYLNFINSKTNTYVSPDGKNWTSEEDYKNSLKSIENYSSQSENDAEQDITADTNKIENNSSATDILNDSSNIVEQNEELQNQTAQIDDEYSKNYYIDMDGFVWASYEDYLACNTNESDNVNQKTKQLTK